MKKILFGLMACAALCACTSDDVLSVANQGGNVSATGDVAYMTVRIKDVNSGTRASDGGFAYGTEAEQTVNNAHFYLYKSDGSYYAHGSLGEVTGEAASETTPGNIEWNSDAVVAIYGITDPTQPTMMLTVLNQPDGINLEHQSFEVATATLAGTPWGASGNLVMSTSTYSSDNAVMNYTALTEDNFRLEPINLEEDYPGTATDGSDSPVDVYVERLAAKVGVTNGITQEQVGSQGNSGVYALSEAVLENFPMGAPTPENENVGGIGIDLLGFDVDCIARDAYVSKQIETSWNFTDFVWNAADSHRSYWAESPNYGVDHTYPTTSNGNTDEDEDTNPLDTYLKYVSLKSPVAIGGTTYCGENTNTVGEEGVIADATSTGLTNVIVKAQLIDYNPNNTSTPKKGIDLIEFHKEYYTVEDFLNKTVEDVVDYDFTVLVAEVITALESQYESLSGYIEELNDAIIHDHIYVSEAVTDHKVTSTNKPSSVSVFDGSMLSLYNISDGNVDIFFNGAEQYYGEAGDGTDGDQVEPTLCGKYKAEDIVYPKEPADLSKYEFYFHVDYDKLSTATQIGAALFNLIVQIDGEYYLPLDNSYYFTSAQTGTDPSWAGNHTYTLRNYFLRAITVEADGIDTQFGSYLPNYYANGMMYYHVPIEHLNSAASDGSITEGEYGVVRNHWYNVTITSLEGLGRGIADEDEVIVPQPELDYYYLGADIDILSWKMVNQEVGW